MMNYGSDMTIDDTPFHVMGLERLVEPQPQGYIGKEALERIRREGVSRKLVESGAMSASSVANIAFALVTGVLGSMAYSRWDRH